MSLPSLSVFAPPSRSDDEPELLDILLPTLSQYAETHLDARRVDRAKAIPTSVLTDLAALGVFGASIPEAYGGAGLSLGGVCAIVATLARHDRAVATTVGLHLGLGTRGMIAFGSEALKRRVLPPLAAGTTIAAFATTEAGAGSDLSAIATRVEAQGDRLRVNGTKIFVTNGGLAGTFTILAQSPGLGGAKRGHTLLLLQRNDAGLSIGPEEEKLGLRGSSTRTVTLDALSIPQDRIIGEAGQGMRQASHVLAWGRTAMAAGCCGTSAAALALTAQHVQTRRQFGRPLSQLAVVRQQVAEMAATQFAMEALVAYTGAAQDNWDLLLRRSVAAKVFASDGNWQLCDLAVQLHGGSGFIEDTGVPLLLRDARVTRIFEGANDVLTIHAGLMAALKLPARAPLQEQLSDAALAQAGDHLYALMATHRDALQKTFRMRLLRRQRHLHQLGQLVIWSEAADAALHRAHAEATPGAFARARTFVALAQRRATHALAELPSTDDLDAVLSTLFDSEAS